ncbi:MAG: transposase, partial [Anaerolineales bacterium]|nr:transposase [Anaerolineales bacterium]
MNEASQLSQFWQQVYQNFNKRADASKDLVDALSSNTRAKSVVELSLEPCFRRDHTSLFKVIAAYQPEQASKSLAQLAAPYLPSPRQRPFWLLGVDTTPQSRLYAQTLKDRSYVYQPAPVKSNKPITIGHQYSEVVVLPEREVQRGSPWVVPLSTQRVSSAEDKELVGAIQVGVLLDDG